MKVRSMFNNITQCVSNNVTLNVYNNEDQNVDDEMLNYVMKMSLLNQENEEDDEDLKLAIKLSTLTEAQQRQKKLDELYIDMKLQYNNNYKFCSNKTIKDIQICDSKTNSLYNKNLYSTPILIDTLTLRILQYSEIATIAKLIQTSKNMSILIKNMIDSNTFTSIKVNKNVLLSAIELFNNTVFAKIGKSLHTLYVKIRNPGITLDMPYRDRIHSQIKHIHLNISHNDELYWFMQSFQLYRGKLTIYHERENWLLYSLTLTLPQIVTAINVQGIIIDDCGHKFNDAINFTVDEFI